MLLLDSTIKLELIGEVNAYMGIGIQILTALFLGGIVGFDREQKMKAAGLKTNILICIGATLYTTISLLAAYDTNNLVDPNRVGAQIVSGIGFLGAGAIIQGRGNVIGLTTAATIWVVAAIGYTIGAGYPISAALFSFTVLLVLKLINPINRFMEKRTGFLYFHLEVLSHGTVKNIVNDIIFKEEIIIDEIHEEIIDESRNKKILNVYLTTHPRKMDRITSNIKRSLKVDKVSYYHLEHLSNETATEK
jgi:putative Mg2+ transporter-C (MgtC) family protein